MSYILNGHVRFTRMIVESADRTVIFGVENETSRVIIVVVLMIVVGEMKSMFRGKPRCV